MAEIEFSQDAMAAHFQDSMSDHNELQSQSVKNSTSNLQGNLHNQPSQIKPAPMTYHKWINQLNNCKESNDRILDQFERDCEIRKRNQMIYEGFPGWYLRYTQSMYKVYVGEFRAEAIINEQQSQKSLTQNYNISDIRQGLRKEQEVLFRMDPQFQSSGQRKQS